MINYWLVTGDLHGYLDRFYALQKKYERPQEVGIIVLGDSGFLFGTIARTMRILEEAKSLLFRFYLVRGNHDWPPNEFPGIDQFWDDNVSNWVYRLPDYPSINFLIDGNKYQFGNWSALVLGGAYSVDKNYRIERGLTWYEHEQLSSEKMEEIGKITKGRFYDIILSHTCPRSWEPTDLFLSSVNQLEVDKTMEDWLGKMRKNFYWTVWLFGHYHDDRVVRPGAEMLFYNIEELNEIVFRHEGTDEEIARNLMFFKKDPKFYMRED